MAERFWVNGTGYWSDITYWSTESGGASGASVPTLSDDVYIDALSFLEGGSIISSSAISVLSLDTTGLAYPVVLSGSNIAIYGSNLALSPEITLGDSNTIWIRSSCNVTMLGDTSEWRLRLGRSSSPSSIIELNSDIFVAELLCDCVFNSNNYTISSNGTIIFTSYSGGDLGTSTVNCSSLQVDGDSTLDYADITLVLPEPRTLYWVDGAGDWTDPEHWSIESDGDGGESIPTYQDSVIIDANSGLSGDTISIPPSSGILFECYNFTSSTGYTYTIYLDDYLYIYGSATFESGLSIDTYIYFEGEDTHIITFDGVSILGVGFEGPGTFNLQDDLIITGRLEIYSGTFNTNNHNIIVEECYINSDIISSPIINMGSGTWEVTEGYWNVNHFDETTTTINPETSTIKVYNTAIDDDRTLGFYDEYETEIGKTYYNVWFTGASETSILIQGSNTFNELRIDTPPQSVYFDDDSTQTVTTFPVSGSSDYLINFSCNDGSWTLNCSGGTIELAYCALENSIATGGTTFNAYVHDGNVDNKGNTGWNFYLPYRYWVGNTGNWNDDNWSEYSGGPSGTSAPSITDDVYFDTNSFATSGCVVTIDGDCYAKSMDWTGVTNNPSLIFNDDDLDPSILIVAGDVTFSPDMDIIFPELYYDNFGGGVYAFGIGIAGDCHLTSAGLELPPIICGVDEVLTER